MNRRAVERTIRHSKPEISALVTFALLSGVVFVLLFFPVMPDVVKIQPSLVAFFLVLLVSVGGLAVELAVWYRRNLSFVLFQERNGIH